MNILRGPMLDNNDKLICLVPFGRGVGNTNVCFPGVYQMQRAGFVIKTKLIEKHYISAPGGTKDVALKRSKFIRLFNMSYGHLRDTDPP